MSVEESVSFITFAREELLRQVADLPEEALTQIPLTAGDSDECAPGRVAAEPNAETASWPLWQDIVGVFKIEGATVKDLLAHIAAWEVRTAGILPLMLADRADEIPPVDVEVFNQQAISARRGHSVAEILAEMEVARAALVEMLTAAGDVALAKRRTRGGRTFTIQSYLVDVMAEHDRVHAEQLRQWRQDNDL